MPSSVPKPVDPPLAAEAEDEEDMTSIMSSDQRKALQHAAAEESETLERDTAKPPPPETAPEAVVIPRAPAVPSELPVARDERPGAVAASPSEASASVWPIVAFVLLAASIVYSLRS